MMYIPICLLLLGMLIAGVGQRLLKTSQLPFWRSVAGLVLFMIGMRVMDPGFTYVLEQIKAVLA